MILVDTSEKHFHFKKGLISGRDCFFTLFIMLLMFSAHVYGAQPSAIYRLDDVTTSPLEDIIIENYRVNESMLDEKQLESVDTFDGASTITQGQIWLSDAENRANRILFESYPRHTYSSSSFLFSPDEKWLVVNIHFVSDRDDIGLYKRTGPLQYASVDVIASDKLWDLFDRSISSNPSKEKLSNRFDHRYVRAIRWSKDSSAFLVGLSGQVSGHIFLEDWLCVFDLETKLPTLDLNKMNRNTLRRVHELDH